MGSLTNGCRTAVPSVEVVDNKATLYIYANNNGYGCYTLTIDDTQSAVENVGVENIDVKKVVENGQVYIIKGDAKFNLLGAEVK